METRAFIDISAQSFHAPLRGLPNLGSHFRHFSKPWKAVFLLLSTVHFAAEDAPTDTLLLITEKGQTLRTRIDTIRETNRYAMGVRLFAVDPSDRIVSASVASTDPDDDTPPPSEADPAPGSAGDPPAEEAPEATPPAS